MFAFFTSAIAQEKADETRIYAYKTYAKDNPDYIPGPIYLTTDDPGTIHPIANHKGLGNIYSGAYYNYKWYARTTRHGTQSVAEDFITIDLETGERTKLASIEGSVQLHDMSFDHSTGKMIGIRTGDNGTDFYEVNLETGLLTPYPSQGANRVSDYFLLAFSISYDGEFYGIAVYDNSLFKIDKTTLEFTLVGQLGVQTAFTQSMSFDYNTGILYWINSGDAHLYTVNTTTGAATDLGELEEGSDAMSMFTRYIDVPVGAPDKVQNVTVAPDVQGAIAATLSWKNPSITAQEAVLTSLMGIKIYRDGLLAQTITTGVNVGGQMSWTDNAANGLTAGAHKYKLVPYNAAGDGGCEGEFDTFIGYDAPGPVRNLTLEASGANGLIKWEAPNTALYGGAYNPSDLQGYKIKRVGTTTEINVSAGATQYMDETLPNWGWYSYEIYAYNAIGNGAVSTTPKVLLNAEGMIIMQNGVFEVCDGTFYDTGGPEGLYQNSEDITMTLKPSTPGAKLRAAFTYLDMDDGYDFLYVYNSDTKDENALIGAFTGESGVIPVELLEVVASNPTGALTFWFKSDIAFRTGGWAADMSCIVPLQKDLRAMSFSGTEMPSLIGLNEYTIEIRNEGIDDVSGSEYTIQILDNNQNVLAEAPGIDILSWETEFVTVVWSPEEEKEMDIVGHIAYDADLRQENNTTEVISVIIQPEGTSEISFGEKGQKISALPIDFVYNNSITETIYPAEIFGSYRGNIVSVAYEATITNSISSKITIWMGETDRTTFQEGGWIFADELTKVYEGEVDFPAGNYPCNFTLDVPHKYNGGNLIVMVFKEADDWKMGNLFWNTYAEHYPSIAHRSDYPLDPNDRDLPTTGYWYWYPDTKFVIQPENYSINITVSPQDYGVVSGAGTYSYGDNAVLSAMPTGYKFFDGWYDERGYVLSNDANYTFKVNRNRNLIARFYKVDYLIEATAGTNGFITPSGNVMVEHGTNQAFTITPNTGYAIDQVLVDGVNIPEAVNNGSYTFINVTNPHTIEATFKVAEFTIYAVAGPGGSIAPSGVIGVSYGDSRTFTILPAVGYRVVQVLIDDENNPEAVANKTYTFENIQASHTINVSFQLYGHPITATAGEGGTINPAGLTIVNHGQSQFYSFTPNQGYQLSQVLIDGANNQESVNNQMYTFSNVTAAHTIHADFTLKSYTITSSATTGGTITPAGATQVTHGGEQTYAFSADANYELVQVLVDGVNDAAAVTAGSYTFVNVTAAHGIQAIFVSKKYEIVATATEGGQISPEGTTTVNHGSKKIYTITPAKGFVINQVLVDGANNTEAVESGIYTFENIADNHTIEAQFKAQTFIITASVDGANGDISPKGNVDVNYSETPTFTITPNEGFRIASVLVDGENKVPAIYSREFTFAPVVKDHTIVVSFEKATYMITAIATGEGTISPAGDIEVEHGANQTFTFTPNDGYKVGVVIADHIIVETADSYTFDNVTKKHRIEVVFERMTDIENVETAQIKLYPNPTNGQLKIENGELEMRYIQFFDITGKLIHEISNIGATELTLDISNFVNGVYFIHIDGKTVKVVKQ
ncbi:MAG: T9SS type A sorting domain-containing protein [Bacteroidales bacterium]|jgi:hypothetical protein|nr:T9SS type A sorting domain-containing protein [Bacteroidales bacterium]